MLKNSLTLLLWTTIWLVSACPRRLWHGVATFSAEVFWLVGGKQRRLAMRNLERALGLSGAAAQRLVKASIRHQVLIMRDTARTCRGMPPKTTGVDNFKRLSDEISSGRGIIYCTGHFGSWDLAGYWGAVAWRELTGESLFALAKPSSKAPVTDHLIEAIRKRLGMGSIWNNQRVLATTIRTLKRNEATGFVCDQKPVGRVGIDTDFFGLQTPFVSGPARIAAKIDCGILLSVALRKPDGTYHVTSEIIRRPGDQDTIEETTQKIAKGLEGLIKANPEQWVWNYKRWRWEDYDGVAVNAS